MKRATLSKNAALSAEEHIRTAEYGPAPVNPFTSIRQQSGLTMEEFAKECGVSKQALIRNEQGTFNGPLPKVLAYCAANYTYSELQLIDSYEEFQYDQRQRHPRYFGDIRAILEVSHRPHPLKVLRGSRTVSEVAKALCLPQATLEYFENHATQQKSVPKLLVEVLRQTGYRQSEVKFLQDAYDCHRRIMLGMEAKPHG